MRVLHSEDRDAQVTIYKITRGCDLQNHNLLLIAVPIASKDERYACDCIGLRQLDPENGHQGMRSDVRSHIASC